MLERHPWSLGLRARLIPWISLVVLLPFPFVALGQLVPAWELTWSDEFDQSDGSAPSPQSWGYDIGGDGWGHQELQYYTLDRRANARIEAGHLVIEARRENYQVADRTWAYTSARLKTQNLHSWTFGRLEARIRVPSGQGLWSAFWMLGDNFTAVGWPDCGEIDIVENLGSESTTVHATVHGPGYSGADGITASTSLSDTTSADGFHLYAVEWSPDAVRIKVDNREYFEIGRRLFGAGPWVFDHPFFLILNVAVGGTWPGSPHATTVFPAQMRVDYVRVYTPTSAPTPQLVIRPSGPESEVFWPSTFPQARLQRAGTPSSGWADVPLKGLVRDEAFCLSVDPGFFRLQL